MCNCIICGCKAKEQDCAYLIFGDKSGYAERKHIGVKEQEIQQIQDSNKQE